MNEPDQQNASNAPMKVGSQELYRAGESYAFPPEEGAIVKKPSKRASSSIILAIGMVAIVGVVGLTLTQKQLLNPKSPAGTDDMGAGVANASGIRGHLVTRWQGKAQYMLKMEPIDPRNAAGFSAVAEHSSKPIFINIRLLDAAGFALCGKQIALPNGVQRAALSVGTDVFRNIQGHDGSVEALWAEGELPCSPDQYKKFDYWDISTNYPTLAEQDVLLVHHPAPIAGTRTASVDQSGSKGRRKLVAKGPTSTFFVEGDDQISMYEPARALLTGDSGHSFFIPVKSDQALAATWAANYSHIHFRCDQHANCALRTGSGSILGRMGD